MIGVIIVNFGDPKDTIDLLKCFIRDNLCRFFKIVVVDNYSNYENLQAIKTSIEDIGHNSITLILSKDNVGFSGANNIGINFLKKDTSIKYLWLLNNDTLLMEDTLSSVILSVKKYPESIIGGTIIYYDSKLTQCLGGSKFNKCFLNGSPIGHSIKLSEAKLFDEDEISHKIDYISGACMLLPIGLFVNDLLDQRYFLYYEEMDLMMRFKKKVSLRWSKNIVIFHKEGRSINGAAYSTGKSDIAEFNTIRSSILFAKKWYPKNYAIYIFMRMLSKLSDNIRKRNIHLIKIDIKALKDALAYHAK